MKIIIVLLLLFNVAKAQVENRIPIYNFTNKLGVGRTGNNDSSAIFQIGPSFGGKGGLGLPRVSNVNAIVGTPIRGLMVYDESKDSVGYYNGTRWIYSGGGSSGNADLTTGKQEFTPTVGQTTFTVTDFTMPVDPNRLRVMRNGVQLKNVTISGSDVIIDPCLTSDKITITRF